MNERVVRSKMTGHHEVRFFELGMIDETLVLSKGWKPFAYTVGYVVARKWVRDETQEKTEEPSA